MPSSIVLSFAKQTNKSVEEVEELCNKAKEIAKEHGQENNYAYITGILKKMLGLNENVSFFEFLSP